MAKRFTLEAVFTMNDKLTAPITRMQNSMGKFTRKATRGLKRVASATSKLASKIKSLALSGVVALTGLGFAIKNIVGVGADFGRAIGSAAAKFPEKIKRGTKAFFALKKVAREVGATTEFTATGAARGLNFLAKAGFKAKDAIAALPSIVDFATASEMGLAEAADIASDAIGSFGLDSDDPVKKLEGLNRIMDVMSKTANSTNTNVAELFEAMKAGGPISATAGAEIETFSAMMGFLASNGIKASQAGTASKNITLALAGVGNKAAKTFENLGISLVDSTGGMRDQLDVLDDLRGKLGGMEDIKKIEIMKAIFGKIPIASAAKLLSDTGVKVRVLRDELEKAGGSSKRTAAFIRNDVKGSLDSLSSSIEGVKISIFDLNEGPLKEGIDKLTDWVRANEKVIASGIGEFLLSLINNFSTIVTWLKNIAIGLAIFAAFTIAVNTASAAMTAFNFVMSLNPLVRIGIAIAAVIIGVNQLTKWILNSFDVWGTLDQIISTVLSSINSLIDGIKFLIDNSDVVFNFVGKGLDSIGNIFSGDDDDKEPGVTKPNISSPQERISKSIQENNNNNTSEILVRSDNASVEIIKNGMGPNLKIQPSGAF